MRTKLRFRTCYNEYDVVKLTHRGLSKKVIETKIVSKYFM